MNRHVYKIDIIVYIVYETDIIVYTTNKNVYEKDIIVHETNIDIIFFLMDMIVYKQT